MKYKDGGAPYNTPKTPFYLDRDGDICDANGWLIVCPAYSVWPDDAKHRRNILDALNGYARVVCTKQWEGA